MHSAIPLPRIVALLFVIAAAIAVASDVRADAEYAFEVVSQQVPTAVHEDAVIEVPLVLRNRGSLTWDPASGFNVAYHWRAADGAMLVFDGERTPLPHAVRPGEVVAISARVRVPIGPGLRLLEWDVVHESVTWFGERAEPAPRTPITVLPARISHAFSVIDADGLRLMMAGRRRKARLLIRNDGIETWEEGREIGVAYHWHHPDPQRAIYDGERVQLPRLVAPGEEVIVQAVVRAPPASGLYALQWDMVEENVVWFSQRDLTDEPQVRVLVYPAVGAAFVTAIACLALVSFVAMRRAPAAGWLLALASIADILWIVGALFFKQRSFLHHMTDAGRGESRWLAVLPVLAIALVISLLPRRARPWTALAVNIAASALFIANLIHFRFFGNVISLASAGSARQIADVLASAASLWERSDIWFVLDIVPGFGIALLLSRLRERTTVRSSRRFALVLTVLMIPGVVTAWRVAQKSKGVTVQVFHNAFLARDLGLLNYHLRDAWVHLRSRVFPRELPPEREAELVRWFERTAPRRAGVEPWFGAARGKNLLMLQVESLQAFVVGLTIDGQEVTPNLNRLQRGGATAFFECSDQTLQGRTSDGEFATQVSLLPLSEGAVAFRYPANDYLAIAEVLGARGYTTVSAVPFDGSFWNRSVTHPQYGFRTSHFGDSFADGIVVGWGLNDRDFLSQMAPRLEALREPFAALLITLSNHHPFETFPDALKRLDLGQREGTPIGNYLHAMHHFDAALGASLEELERRGLASETVIAIWGDHVAGFRWDSEFAALAGHGLTEPEYFLTQAVPVAVIVPGARSLAPDDKPCGHVDLAPTLLALLGVDPAPLPLLGRNLFGNAGDAPVVQQYGVWQDSKHMFLPKGAEVEDGHCYDRATLHRLPPDLCRSGFLAAREEMNVSQDVIEYDLQAKLARALGER